MLFDNAEGVVYRPPSEVDSLILRVTIGCSHNACAFCSMYKDVRFRIRPMDEVAELIKQAALARPDVKRVFLADGNALVLRTEKLLKIIDLINKSFPKLSRISCYAGPMDILRKTPGELESLKRAGVKMMYLGVESGDPETLFMVNKGVTPEEMVSAGQKVMAAGIKLSAMVILGLGGKERTKEHAINTARVISAINPTVFSTLTLTLDEGTELQKAVQKGQFITLNPLEIMMELKLMIANINLSKQCLFRNDHPFNLVPLTGKLPREKELLLSEIDEIIEYLQENK